MRIFKLSLQSNFQNANTKQRKNQNKLAFTSSKIWGRSAYLVERRLSDKGITSEFKNNSFIAESVEKIVNVFENVFGRNSLPNKVVFAPIETELYGYYAPAIEKIGFNSRYSCFKNFKNLKHDAESGWNLFGHNEYSTTHPANTFVHEFAHCAHKHYLDSLYDNSSSRLLELNKMKIPNVIGRFIAKCKLGNYAVDGGMEEFMAERLTKDLCEKLTDKSFIFIGNKEDYDYSNIFSRKWNCRYSTPQAYLDYYTQQVWNCNMKEAKVAEKLIEKHLEEIDRPEPVKVKQKQLSLAGCWDAFWGKVTEQAKRLDNYNQIKHLQYQ